MQVKTNKLYEPNYDATRIINKIAPRLMHDEKIALTELIANSWDADATCVYIEWPYSDNKTFSITDNGIGMSENDVINKWSRIAYNKIETEGNTTRKLRKIYGKNGVGKFAIFYFSNNIYLETKSIDSDNLFYEIKKTGNDKFFSIEKKERHDQFIKTSGTKISCESRNVQYTVEEIKEYLSKKFIFLPEFNIFLNNEKLHPEVLLNESDDKIYINIQNDQVAIYIFLKNAESSNKNVKMTGVAWIVNGRFVGNPSRKIQNYGKVFDGRTEESKKFLFVVEANNLSDIVNEDWTGFDYNSEKYNSYANTIFNSINNYITKYNDTKDDEFIKNIERKSNNFIIETPLSSRKMIRQYIHNIVKQCPHLTESDINNLIKILCNLEKSNSKYSLLSALSKLHSSELDELNNLLEEWSIEMAKCVLDEIKSRTKLIENLKAKAGNEKTLEVAELQPLIERSLWMFGPEFESIEYTSNESIAKCYQKYIGLEPPNNLSRNRPDFTATIDRSVSFYSSDRFNSNFEVDGIGTLVIIELKAPRIIIGRDEKNQPQKYYDEFMSCKMIDNATRVIAFVIGSKVKNGLSEPNNDGQITTHVMTYDTLIRRAEARLLNLYNKIKNAPFLEKYREELDEIKLDATR